MKVCREEYRAQLCYLIDGEKSWIPNYLMSWWAVWIELKCQWHFYVRNSTTGCRISQLMWLANFYNKHRTKRLYFLANLIQKHIKYEISYKWLKILSRLFRWTVNLECPCLHYLLPSGEVVDKRKPVLHKKRIMGQFFHSIKSRNGRSIETLLESFLTPFDWDTNS